MTYRWMPLSEVLKHEPEMVSLKVSEVARSRRGFLTAYKRLGVRIKDYPVWPQRRSGFIARHLAQYRDHPTRRRRLALIAWAYNPDRKA